MVTEERLTTYINSLEKDNNVFLEDLRKEAVADGVPIIRRETESFLRILLKMKKPGAILEIGSGVAYSAVFMATYSDARIRTIENYEKRITAAEKNIEASGFSERITLVKDDALNVLAKESDEYDLIFLDAAKGQYIEMLPDILRVLKPEGILIADNVLQEGEIAESRFSVSRRQRTIHERMREYLWSVKHNDELDTSILTIGDGIALSIKNG